MSDLLPDDSPAAALSGMRIAQAAGLVMIGFILSRVLGLARDIIIAGVFGAGKTVDIFFAASRPPETIFFVVAGGALGSAFIPQFVGLIAKNKSADAWKMASVVANLIALILIAVSALGAVFAEPLTRVLALGFDAPATLLTADLMRVMLISPAIFGLSGLAMGVLNAHQRFLLPALAPAMYNLGIIGGAIFLSPFMGIYGLAWGTVIGAALHLAVQLPGLIRLKPQYHFSLDWKAPGVWDVARLMGPRVLGLSIVQINFWVELTLASGMVEGSISALRRAFYVMLLPQGVIAQSMAIAIFPTFSAQAAQGDQAALRKTLGQALNAVAFLSLPATVGLIILRLPIVRLMFERNAFTPQDSEAVAWALLFYGLGLVAHGLLEVVTRAYYALHDTRTPVAVGGGAMILNIVFSLILMQIIGVQGSLTMGPFGGLALANTLATGLEVGALLILIRPRLAAPNITSPLTPLPLGEGYQGETIPSGGQAAAIGRMILASAGMGLALWAALPLTGGSGLSLAVATLSAILGGSVIYWGIAWALGSEEARLFARFALDRLRRARSA